MRRMSLAVFSLSAALAVPGVAQIEIDRIVSKVYATNIRQSDLRQARLLKLCPKTDSDELILAELQNRTLILAELARVPPADPTEDELAARRREWDDSIGGADRDGLLGKAGMSARELQTWLRDDVRIKKYLDQRFGRIPEAERAGRIQEWIRTLRQRAALGSK